MGNQAGDKPPMPGASDGSLPKPDRLEVVGADRPGCMCAQDEVMSRMSHG